jgi:hypothetical protein
MSRLGRPPGDVRRALQGALDAGLSGTCAALAEACGLPREHVSTTLKNIRRARRQRSHIGRFDALAFVREAWR